MEKSKKYYGMNASAAPKYYFPQHSESKVCNSFADAGSVNNPSNNGTTAQAKTGLLGFAEGRDAGQVAGKNAAMSSKYY
jgi:hypothetical protein